MPGKDVKEGASDFESDIRRRSLLLIIFAQKECEKMP